MNKEVLEHLYITERMTKYEIAELFGTSTTTVTKRLKQYNILLRPGVNRKYLTTNQNRVVERRARDKRGPVQH